jgi:ABC-type multidrug transport system fused ATPase/permease subunit
MKPSLLDINLSIKKNIKIGVLGRTGSGKTSLTLAMTRIIELSDGNI